jgi:hypothetical protein
MPAPVGIDGALCGIAVVMMAAASQNMANE